MHLPNGADGREDLPGRAIAALKPIAVQEGSLHRVKVVALGEAFNGDDVLTFASSCKSQTRQDTLAVDDDGARAASALIASFLRAGQTEYVAKRIQQRHALVQREFVGSVIHTKCCFHDLPPGLQRRGLRIAAKMHCETFISKQNAIVYLNS